MKDIPRKFSVEERHSRVLSYNRERCLGDCVKLTGGETEFLRQ